MKLNTISRYKHTASLSPVHYITNPDTGAAIPQWSTTVTNLTSIACKFITPTGGNLRVYSKVQLKTFDRLMSPKDAGGTALFDEVATLGFQITTVSPILNPMGFIDGYAYGIKRLIKEGV